jgi:hypothetical protein
LFCRRHVIEPITSTYTHKHVCVRAYLGAVLQHRGLGVEGLPVLVRHDDRLPREPPDARREVARPVVKGFVGWRVIGETGVCDK